MADEAAPTSIADRIAALKLNQVGRVPVAGDNAQGAYGVRTNGQNSQRRPPPPPPARPELPARPNRPQSTNNPPTQDYAAASSRGIGNQPEQAGTCESITTSRPPLPSRTSQASLGPGLPPRRTSEHAAPALPSRRLSEAPSLGDYARSRRGSNESVSSVATARSSISGISNATSLTSTGGSANRVRAPEYDPASLPKLPPNRTKEQKEADARKYAGLRPLRQTKSTPKAEQIGKETTPPPPARPTQRIPPVLPGRTSRASDQLQTVEPEPTPPPVQRQKLEPAPPPRPRQSALSFGMNKATESIPQTSNGRTGPVPQSNGMPPPIPTSSKPNLAALQASKPRANGRSTESAVIELTPADFDDVVLRSGRPTLVDFYLPWCVPCKDFAPTYEELARSFNKDFVTIAKFDNGNHKAIGEKYGVNCWPTLLWFDGRSDDPIDYRPLCRGWDVDGLSNFITEKTGIAPQPVQAAPYAAAQVCMHCRDFSAPDNHAARFPRQTLPTTDLGWLAHQLTSPFASLTDKARAIFTWLHHNVAYDTVAFFNNNVQRSTPQSTLESGLAVCEGYAGLFSALALKAGLEAMVVSGHGKGYGYSPLKPGESVPPYKAGHAWNAVKIDNGEWKLIDCCWGAGHVKGKDQPYQKHFSPERFTQTNEDFGRDHFPGDRSHQFRTDGRVVTWEEYFLGNKSGTGATTLSGYLTEEGLDMKTFQPSSGTILLRQAGPTVRFSFQKICPHWDPVRCGKGPYYLYVLHLEGLDGTKRNHIPFETNGDVWWCDVPTTDLGQPGQKAKIYAVSEFNNQNSRGLTIQEYRQKKGRVYMMFGVVCVWEIA